MTKENLGQLIFVIFLATLFVEIIGGRHKWSRDSLKGGAFAVVSVIMQFSVSTPVVAFIVSLALDALLPNSENRFAGASFWLVFPVVFVAEEFCHYWIHRWAHEKRWLWKLHRTHHSARELNALVLFRFNIFWTAMQPQLWFGAAMLHLGLVEVFAAGSLIAFIVNVFTHTSYRWDLAMRKWPGMNPVFNVLEKIITLPDTHHAHHGLGKLANAKGNYAVTIFLFDTLLGTGKWPRAKQERFGLPGNFDWREELFWPIVRKGLVREKKVSAPV